MPATVLPAKSDSDVMFCLQSYRGLTFQDRINTQVIYQFALAQVLAWRISKCVVYKLMFNG